MYHRIIDLPHSHWVFTATARMGCLAPSSRRGRGPDMRTWRCVVVQIRFIRRGVYTQPSSSSFATERQYGRTYWLGYTRSGHRRNVSTPQQMVDTDIGINASANVDASANVHIRTGTVTVCCCTDSVCKMRNVYSTLKWLGYTRSGHGRNASTLGMIEE